MRLDESYYTTPDVLDDFKIFDIHSIELAKNALLSVSHEEKITEVEKDTDAFKIHTSPKSAYINKQEYNNTWNVLKKMGKLPFSLVKFQNGSHIDVHSSGHTQVHSHKSDKKSNDTTSFKVMTEDANADSKSRLITSQSKVKSYSYISENKIEEQTKIEDVTLEEETDNANSEELIAEDSLRSLESLLSKINVSDLFNSKKEKEKCKLDKYGKTVIGKHTNCHSQSMLPESRPSYLEIQRNDWKRDDEHHDYDNTVNNNYFS